MEGLETSGKPSTRSDDGLLNSAPSMTPRSSAGTISPPARVVTATPRPRPRAAGGAPARGRQRGAQRAVGVGREADRAVLEAAQILGTGELLLEPAEGLGRHRAGEEAHEVQVQVLDELVVEVVAPAVVHPGPEART